MTFFFFISQSSVPHFFFLFNEKKYASELNGNSAIISLTKQFTNEGKQALRREATGSRSSTEDVLATAQMCTSCSGFLTLNYYFALSDFAAAISTMKKQFILQNLVSSPIKLAFWKNALSDLFWLRVSDIIPYRPTLGRKTFEYFLPISSWF